eukprot:COSAG01_NODE_23865_length_799_cov_0.794286_2_plen_54_part_00
MAQVPPTVRRQVTAYMDNFYSNKTAFDEVVRAGVPLRSVCLRVAMRALVGGCA